MREPRRLEARGRAAGEAREEQHAVVDVARALAPGAGDLALGHEGPLDRSVDLDDLLAQEEARHVDDVRVQVAVRSRAGELALEAPRQRRLRTAPALQVARAHVVDPSQAALADQTVRERDRGTAAIVEPHERADPVLRRLARR